MTGLTNKLMKDKNKITPKYTLDWYIKWLASVFVLGGMTIRGTPGFQEYDLIFSSV